MSSKSIQSNFKKTANDAFNSVVTAGTPIYDSVVKQGTDLYNQAVRTGTPVYDTINQAGTAVLNTLAGNDAANGSLQKGTSVQKPKPSTLLEAENSNDPGQQFLKGAIDNVYKYVSEIPDKGAIPVPTINRDHYGIATGRKAVEGVFGMPLRIMSNPDMESYKQRQVDRATDLGNGIYSYGLKDKGYEVDPGFGRGAIGQWWGKVDPSTNKVIAMDERYDTNDNVGQQSAAALHHLKEGEFSQAAYRGIIGNTVAALGPDGINWINPYPLGKKIVMGQAPNN